MAAQSEWEKEQEQFTKMVKAAAKVLVQHMPQEIILRTAETLIANTLKKLGENTYQLASFVDETVKAMIKEKVKDLLDTKYKGQVDELANKAAEKAIVELMRGR